MDKNAKTKKPHTNILEPLLDRIKARAERLWGENDSESNVVATALRDWLSQSERGSLESRIDQMERRIDYLLTTRPADGFRDDRPTLDDPHVRLRLGLEDRRPPSMELPKLPTPADFAKLGRQLVRNHREKKIELDFIGVESLLGYDSSGSIDYSAYERAGFPLLRNPQSYSLDNPTMRQYLESCFASTKLMYTPILIYFSGGILIVLDGLARFTVMLEARSQSNDSCADRAFRWRGESRPQGDDPAQPPWRTAVAHSC